MIGVLFTIHVQRYLARQQNHLNMKITNAVLFNMLSKHIHTFNHTCKRRDVANLIFIA